MSDDVPIDGIDASELFGDDFEDFVDNNDFTSVNIPVAAMTLPTADGEVSILDSSEQLAPDNEVRVMVNYLVFQTI